MLNEPQADETTRRTSGITRLHPDVETSDALLRGWNPGLQDGWLPGIQDPAALRTTLPIRTLRRTTRFNIADEQEPESAESIAESEMGAANPNVDWVRPRQIAGEPYPRPPIGGRARPDRERFTQTPIVPRIGTPRHSSQADRPTNGSTDDTSPPLPATPRPSRSSDISDNPHTPHGGRTNGH